MESEKEALEEYEKYDKERRICIYFLTSSDIREKESEVRLSSVLDEFMVCRLIAVISTERVSQRS